MRHSEIARTTHNIGVLHMIQQNKMEAHDYLQSALAMRLELLPANHVDTAVTLLKLAKLMQMDGDLHEARQKCAQAFEIFQKALSPHHKHWKEASELNSILHQ